MVTHPPSSEDDPFGWGGDVDQNHHITSDQELFCSPDEQVGQSVDTGCRLPPSLARGDTTYAAVDPTDSEIGRLDQDDPGAADSCHCGIKDLAMELGTDVSEPRLTPPHGRRPRTLRWIQCQDLGKTKPGV